MRRPPGPLLGCSWQAIYDPSLEMHLNLRCCASVFCALILRMVVRMTLQLAALPVTVGSVRDLRMVLIAYAWDALPMLVLSLMQCVVTFLSVESMVVLLTVDVPAQVTPGS